VLQSPTSRNLTAEMACARDAKALVKLAASRQSGSVGSAARPAALDKIAVAMAAMGGGEYARPPHATSTQNPVDTALRSWCPCD
jgi:hypothetical protein